MLKSCCALSLVTNEDLFKVACRLTIICRCGNQVAAWYHGMISEILTGEREPWPLRAEGVPFSARVQIEKWLYSFFFDLRGYLRSGLARRGKTCINNRNGKESKVPYSTSKQVL